MVERRFESRGWVNWPTPCNEGKKCELVHDAWHDCGEDGMEVWLLIRYARGDAICNSGGYINFGYYPVNQDSLVEDLLPPDDPARSGEHMANAAILMGSVSRAPWNPLAGEYFDASKEDFTEEGRALFDLLTRLFGREPEIVTSLDT